MSMHQSEFDALGTRYAAAWSSGHADRVAAFYADGGSLTVNGGAPAVGREAIRQTAEGFMLGFPDMVVRMDSMVPAGGTVRFHWDWTGTNTGPGGTGKAVHLKGFEELTFGADGLITRSLGHYDEAEYQRQVHGHPAT